ncbi:MAG: hypothetical protein QOC84_1789 [Bradyrhizobium sp.]|jgi:hypothetical protein|nr:hypothetical protein [Bradyrhizobium sp.]
MKMKTGLDRIELTGISGSSGRPAYSAARFFRSGLIWLPVSLIAGLAVWILLSGYASNVAQSAGSLAESEPPHLVNTAAVEPAPSQAPDAATSDVAVNPAGAEAVEPEQPAPVDGLKIASQSWRRGGLGSVALITFTLKNTNDYAVKDIQISCAFNRRDGSHLTDRARVIHDTVNKKSRKTFARLHVGFVNVNADKAKCSLVAASPV